MSINNIVIRPLSWLKQWFVKKGRLPYRVPCGLFRDLRLHLDLRGETQIYLGFWERETYTYIRNAARRCEWVIDVGAGKGELCLYFLKHSRAEPILAFEPQSAETHLIRDNIALNGELSSHRVVVENKFVGTRVDPTYVSLDSLNLDMNKFGFIKIDVDGSEVDVLKSADDLFARGSVGLLLETHSKQLEDECVEWLRAKGYETSIIKNAWWRVILPEQRPTLHNRWLWAVRASAVRPA